MDKPGWHDSAFELNELDEIYSIDLENAEEELSSDDTAVLEDAERFAMDTALQEIVDGTSYGEVFLQDLIRRQLSLSLGVAAIFLSLLLGMPLVYTLFPELGSVTALGLPIHWLLLAGLMYPFLWLLAAYYTRAAKRREDEFTKLLR